MTKNWQVRSTRKNSKNCRDEITRLNEARRRAEKLEMIIGLENPGNGEDNLFNLAVDGLRLLERIDSPFVRLNYDAGHTVSHRPALTDPAGDALLALSGCAHLHRKDVQSRRDGYYFVPIGDGDLDSVTILQSVKARPALNIAIEVPLRFHRDLTEKPCRNRKPVDLGEIERALRKSLDFVQRQLG